MIDVEDIGLVTAKVLIEPGKHENKSYELTNNQILTFTEIARKLSEVLGKEIEFISPGILRFYLSKRREGMSNMFIFVMIMLHYFPRFQKTPEITDWVKIITGREPKMFAEFDEENIEELQ